MSLATLLSQRHPVTAVDVIPEKVDLINQKESPIQDEYIEKYLAEKTLDLTATLDGAAAYRDAELVVVATPTNYDPLEELLRHALRGGRHRAQGGRFLRGRGAEDHFRAGVPAREQGAV